MPPEKTNVRREVREALQEKQVNDLQASMSLIGSQIVDGFKGVHTRQDTTNGRLTKQEETMLIYKGEVEKKFMEFEAKKNSDIQSLKAQFKYNRFIWYVLTVTVGIVIFLATKQ